MLFLTGCAYVGNPLPPALDIPVRVSDLAVAEYGDKLRLQFTIPALTTEGLALKSVQSVELYAGPAVSPFDQNAWAASAKRIEIPAAGPGPVNFDTPASQWIGEEIVAAIRVTGPKGKISDWSNLISLPVQPPLSTPADVKPENQPNAIVVTWKGAGPRYRVFRATGDAQPELAGETESPEYRDTAIEYGTQYRYYVQAIAGELQQSEMAGPFSITAQDKFAPSVPAGLTAELGTNSVELSWERNTEPRFQGYNVYRSVENGPFEKIASSIVSPAYSDRQVEAGKKYRYQVSSVGTNGLESARSMIAEVTAQ